ncbi:MAG: hypothetical protein P4M12_11680 [Gammaproteobacteria bacterium]|nr:hypothetical protein [Gammaproteobacteria bacterium]
MQEQWLHFSDLVGICGVIMLLAAYLMLSMGKWSSHSLIYQVINFASAWFILFSLYYHWNISSVLIEIAWIIISSIGIYRTLYPSKQKKFNN